MPTLGFLKKRRTKGSTGSDQQTSAYYDNSSPDTPTHSGFPAATATQPGSAVPRQSDTDMAQPATLPDERIEDRTAGDAQKHSSGNYPDASEQLHEQKGQQQLPPGPHAPDQGELRHQQDIKQNPHHHHQPEQQQQQQTQSSAVNATSDSLNQQKQSSSSSNVPSIQNLINQPNSNTAGTQSTAANAGQTADKTAFMADDGGISSYTVTSLAPQQNPVRATKGKYTLSDFTIERTLGTGSFGRVHLVQSKHNQRFYAIKVLKKGQVVKMKQVEHTNDERRMLQKVKHPFLITLWGTFQDARNLYMVMDFVEGGELFSLLRKSQRFPNPVAKFYAAEVTLALDYLHTLNVIYRDLKPENLLLDRHGHLKITDFGFAKEVPDITWTLCGTPDYLAPEVVASKGYNKSVDWWSLGILIFEMLCGFTPFWDGASPMKIYENILKGRVKYPPYIHPDAQDLLQKLITPDLTKRLGNLHGGSKDVMQHPWFAEVTWDRLAKKDIDAPYIPPVRAGTGDASQFDKYPEETEPYGQNGDDPHGLLFGDF